MPNEEFEKWADENSIRGLYWSIARPGYNARQPEIDALKAALEGKTDG